MGGADSRQSVDRHPLAKGNWEEEDTGEKPFLQAQNAGEIRKTVQKNNCTEVVVEGNGSKELGKGHNLDSDSKTISSELLLLNTPHTIQGDNLPEIISLRSSII